MVVAPEFENNPQEEDVILIPAIPHVNGSPFSLQLPIPGVLSDALYDLIALAHHPDAGSLILFGWRSGSKRITFPSEHGAHAGFAPTETHAFALLPQDAPLPARAQRYLRPSDLKGAALHVLGRSKSDRPLESRPRKPEPLSLRVMTYNVHRCIGTDGKISPERITRVIARHDPDVVALQEVDQGRTRTHGSDQAKHIAEIVEMAHHFHPVLSLAEGNYGNAILTRHPLRVVKTGCLPQLRSWKRLEMRGALWAEILVDGHPVKSSIATSAFGRTSG